MKRLLAKIKHLLKYIVERTGSKYHYISIFEYIFKFPDRVRLLNLSIEESIYAEAVHYNQNNINNVCVSNLKKGLDLFDWLAVIKDVKCFADSDLIITNDGYSLYEAKDYQTISKYGEYTYNPILCDTQKYCKIRRRQSINVDKAFLLEGLWSWNWYHFVMQILPKIKYVSLLPKDVPILVGGHLQGDNNFSEIFRIFLSKYGKDREVIYMQYGYMYCVKQLYTSSLQTLIIPDIKKNVKGGLRAEWCLYKQSTIAFIRNTLLSEKCILNDCSQKIYISRKNASMRRRFNEKEIINMLKDYGYLIISPEEYSVAEQVSIFNKAKCIIAASGAGLTNLLFCQPECKVIIINNYRQTVGIFNTIATVVGANVISVNANDYEMMGDNLQDSFTISPEKLLGAMSQMDMLK